MSSKLPVVLLLTTVLMASVAVSAIPASNALIQRDYSYLNDNHLTVRTGNTKVCGDHLCAPGEWDKLQESLNSAQFGNGTKSTPTTAPSTPTTSTPSNMCTLVKNALADSNAGATITQSVLSKLGC
ncbi:MAG: hypothetical protein KGI27_01135 [Thaumarchaeota archaeon]|nr:hypothetical protein [Nitrososphaerota archaeon]